MNNKTYVCLDTETTGLDPVRDFIIQLSAVKLDENLNKIGEFDKIILPVSDFTISRKAQETHGYTKEFIKEHGVLIKDIAQEFLDFVGDSDIISYNGNNFDIKFIVYDFKQAGFEFSIKNRKFFDSYAMECKFNPRDLTSVYKKYTGQTFENSHNSLADVYATVEVFKNQLKTHDLNIEDIKEWSENNLLDINGMIRRAGEDLIVFAQGKYKDSDIFEIVKTDPDYFKWCWNKVFDNQTKEILQSIYIKIKNN